MATLLTVFIAALKSIFRTRAALQLENLALRHRIGMLPRTVKARPRLASVDRLFWAWLSILTDWLPEEGRQPLGAVSST